MTRPTQLSLIDALEPVVTETVEAEGVTYAFSFIPGPECTPGPEPDDEMSRWFNDPARRWGVKGAMTS